MTEVTLIRPIMRWKRSTALLVAMMLVLSLSFPMLALAVSTTTQWRVVYWDEGTVLWGGYVADGGNATPPSNPVKTGYTFSGWSNDGTNITADRNIYAEWKIDTFKVNYYDGPDGELIDSQTINYGEDSTPPVDPTKPGHTFTDWSGTATNVMSDINIYAQWDINYYTVEYYDDGEGNLIDSQEVAYGSNATPPSNPVREGHDFTGWSNDGTNISEDTYIYANWDRSEYTVSYYDGEELLSSQTVLHGENALTPKDPSKEGYTFVRWDSVDTNVTSNLDIYAVWDINYYTVNYYHAVDGSLFDSQEVAYGSNATPPASDPVIPGYTFAGWSSDGTNITGDTNIYGEWSRDLYTVSFYSEGKLLQTYVYYYGDPATPPETPSRTGYTFAQWSEDSSSVTGDMTINAEWDINYYTVNYYDDFDGNLIDSQEVAYGSAAIAPDAPNNVGFAFEGWSGDDTNITEDSSFYAEWTADWNAVVFTNEGSIVDYQAVPNGAAAVAPMDPTKEGYTFVGWYASEEMPFGTEAPIFEDVIYQAVWKINTFTVNYYDDVEGNLIESQSVNWMDDAAAPADPTREGYTFDGWSSNGVGIERDTNIYASWKINTFTVNYYDDLEGNLIESQSVNWMDDAAAPADPTREGYTFDGWSSKGVGIDRDTNIYANWQINTFTVNYYDDLEGNLVDSQTVNWMSDAEAPADPTREGYTFDGWSSNGVGIDRDTNIYANWQINTFTVNYYDDFEGNLIDSQTVNWMSDAEAPADPTREGYTFDGWSSKGVEITSDTNIYANWQINTFTVNYYDDVEGDLIDSQSVNWMSDAEAPADPRRDGYTFAGWSADGVSITGDTSIYATWENITYTVNYYDDFEGNLIDSQTVNWMDDAVVPEDPTREGYTFDGWSSNGIAITNDEDVYANWTINYYNVNYYDDVEGKLISEQSIAYGSDAKAPANPTKTGFVFTGWSADGTNVMHSMRIVATWRAISTDATLSNISSQWGKWDSYFTPADGSYRLNLSTSKNTTRVVATKSSRYAQVYVSFDGINWTHGSTATVTVARGTSTRLYFKVIAESGAEKIYKLKFVRAE